MTVDRCLGAIEVIFTLDYISCLAPMSKRDISPHLNMLLLLNQLYTYHQFLTAPVTLHCQGFPLDQENQRDLEVQEVLVALASLVVLFHLVDYYPEVQRHLVNHCPQGFP